MELPRQLMERVDRADGRGFEDGNHKFIDIDKEKSDKSKVTAAIFDECDDIIIRRYSGCFTWREIADILGHCTQADVKKRAKALGVDEKGFNKKMIEVHEYYDTLFEEVGPFHALDLILSLIPDDPRQHKLEMIACAMREADNIRT